MGGFQGWNVAAVTSGIIERLQPIAAARDVNRVKHIGIELNAPQGAPEGSQGQRVIQKVSNRDTCEVRCREIEPHQIHPEKPEIHCNKRLAQA